MQKQNLVDHTQELVQTTLAKLFESILNQAIQLDEMHGEGFAAVDEKVIQLSFTDLRHSFFLVYQIPSLSAETEESARLGQFTVQMHLMGTADSHIRTTLSDWLTHKTQAPDATGQAFLDAIHAIDIDWEEQLSKYVGDAVAFKVGSGVRSTRKTVESAKQKAGQTLQEYLTYEVNLLPTKAQVRHFNQQVSDLAQATEALEARIAKLTQPSD